MEEGFEQNENQGKNGNGRDEIFSQTFRAGKRTYFFDVRATRREEYYLSITESKKRFGREGKPFFEKHKIFLYKEDFDGFMEGLNKVIDYILNEQPLHQEQGAKTDVKETEVTQEMPVSSDEPVAEDFTNVDFEDLGEKNE